MEYIEIRGYKSIEDLKIHLTPINILIGANGAGKSNFISFFEFLDNLYNKKLQEYVGLNGGIEAFLYRGAEYESEMIEGLVRFQSGANSYSFQIKKSGNSFVFSKEILWYYGAPLEYNNFSKEAEVKDNGWYRGKFIQKHITGNKKYHFHDTGKNSPFNKMSNIEKDIYFLYDKGENLAAFLYKIKTDHPKVYSRIIKNIKSIAPYFSDFFFAPNTEGYLKLQWQDIYSSYVYGVTDFSDGTIRYIALCVLFMQPNLPDTIIIDEPELGLHPFAIAKLASMIEATENSGTQVIIATQSADLISYFKPESIITVDQQEGKSVFKRLESEPLKIWLEDFSIGNLWQRNIIKTGQPF